MKNVTIVAVVATVDSQSDDGIFNVSRQYRLPWSKELQGLIEKMIKEGAHSDEQMGLAKTGDEAPPEAPAVAVEADQAAPLALGGKPEGATTAKRKPY